MKRLFCFLALFLLVCGCFSVMRIPVKLSAERIRNPETGEWVETNVVYGTCPNYPMCVYPTLHMRWHLVSYAWEPADVDYRWRHFWGPVAGLVSLIGLPGDFLVDTCYLYNDWDASTTNRCPMCEEIKGLKQRASQRTESSREVQPVTTEVGSK